MAAQPRFIYPVILALVAIIGCGAPPPTVVTSVPGSTSNNVALSILVDLEGPTYVKREGWVDYQSKGFGTLIYPTDLIKTDGEISLLCPDLQSVMQFTDLGRNPCPLPTRETFLFYDQMLFSSASRGTPHSDIPYILYPRNTLILEKQPILQWHDTGATSYTVELWEGATLIWKQTNIVGNEFQYPLDASSLETDKDYLLIVTDNDTKKKSTSDPNKGLGFQIVNETQLLEVESKTQDILTIPNLDSAAKNLVLAMYYDQLNINGRALLGEAQKMLEEVAKINIGAPAVHLQYGNTLAKMKLWAEAQIAYESTLAQAQTLNDLESQADALAALWSITGNQAQFNQAVEIYKQIGAEEKAERLIK